MVTPKLMQTLLHRSMRSLQSCTISVYKCYVDCQHCSNSKTDKRVETRSLQMILAITANITRACTHVYGRVFNGQGRLTSCVLRFWHQTFFLYIGLHHGIVSPAVIMVSDWFYLAANGFRHRGLYRPLLDS